MSPRHPSPSAKRKPRCEPELYEAKRVLARAKALALLEDKDLANALDCSLSFAQHVYNPSQIGDHMRVADLLRLSKQPAMRVFVTEVLSAIQANFDQKHLRVSDLELLSDNTATAELARTALTPVVAKLWPEIGQRSET